MAGKSNLDLLRSMAVTMVVVDHSLMSKGVQRWGSWHIEDIGLFGVYLFFLHTSLVLMWSLERRPNAIDFYIRRAYRIYPLAVLAILLAAVTRAPVAGTASHFFSASPFTWAGLLVNCLLLNRGHYPVMLAVTWSLSAEVYMYVLLPAFFLIARYKKQRWPLVLIWIIVVLYKRHSFHMGPEGNIFTSLVPDFLAGVIAYAGFMRAKARLSAWTILPLLVLLFAGYMSFHPLRGDWIACLVLALVLPYIKQFEWKPGVRGAHTLATYSYGLYLFHSFSLVLGMYLLRGRPLALQLGVEIGSLGIAAFIGYHAIEFPMIKMGARVAARLVHERGLPSKQTLEELEPAP